MRTEKEKMLAGDLYDASDPILAEERRQAHEFNNIDIPFGRGTMK